MGRIPLKSRRDLDAMRKSGAVVAEVLMALANRVAPGVSTADLDVLTYQLIRRRGVAMKPRTYIRLRCWWRVLPWHARKAAGRTIAWSIPIMMTGSS